jgi:hypothetical protein
MQAVRIVEMGAQYWFARVSLLSLPKYAVQSKVLVLVLRVLIEYTPCTLLLG